MAGKFERQSPDPHKVGNIGKRQSGLFAQSRALLGLLPVSAFLPALAMLYLANLVLFGIWLLLVGSKLYKLGGR